MEGIWVYIIPLVVMLGLGFLAGRRQRFSTFLKELGEALVETSRYINLDKPSEEDTQRLKKEWKEAIEAGGSLVQKLLKAAERR